MGTALVELGRRAGLTDDDIGSFDQARSRSWKDCQVTAPVGQTWDSLFSGARALG